MKSEIEVLEEKPHALDQSKRVRINPSNKPHAPLHIFTRRGLSEFMIECSWTLKWLESIAVDLKLIWQYILASVMAKG
jgi:hypothetical protein